MPLRPDEESLLASLEMVALGQAPTSPPLLDALEQWGYAQTAPVALTGAGHELIVWLREQRLIPQPPKPKKPSMM